MTIAIVAIPVGGHTCGAALGDGVSEDMSLASRILEDTFSSP